MVEKDRSVILNKTNKIDKMLLPLYQTHLENQLESSELLFLELIINVLQDIKEVSLEKIATALPIPILFESRRKKVQRFLSLPSFNLETFWFPTIKNWLAQNFSSQQIVYLVIDRTIWARKNLIMISIIYDRRAIPVYFQFLPKLGSSNLAEQKQIISQVLPLFKAEQTILLGDREFCSIKLANWRLRAKTTVLFKIKKE